MADQSRCEDCNILKEHIHELEAVLCEVSDSFKILRGAVKKQFHCGSISK